MPVPNRNILSRKAVTKRSSSHHKNAIDHESEKPGSLSNKTNESEDQQKESEQKGKNEGEQKGKNEGDQQDEKKDEQQGENKTKGPLVITGPADAIKTIVKIFPSSTKNDEGYYIADIRVLTDQKKKPFSIADSLDFKLENMLEHISNLSKASQFPVQKDVKDAGGYIDASKLDMNNYMKHDTTEFLILPTKYSTPADDAKAKKKDEKKDEKEEKEDKAAGGHRGGKKYSRKTKRRVSRTRKEHRKKNI